jgi:hypothetical protein
VHTIRFQTLKVWYVGNSNTEGVSIYRIQQELCSLNTADHMMLLMTQIFQCNNLSHNEQRFPAQLKLLEYG